MSKTTILSALDFSSFRFNWGRRHWFVSVGCVLLCAFAVVGLISYKNSIEPAGIIIHHTGPVSADGAPIQLGFLDQLHEQRGYGGFYWGHTYHVGYHYIILPNGAVQEGRPEHLQGAHARGFNTYLGIAVVGNFSEKTDAKGPHRFSEPSPAQLRSLVRLCQRLSVRYHIPASRVLRHSDVAQTECPGKGFPYREILAAVYSPTVVAQRPVR